MGIQPVWEAETAFGESTKHQGVGNWEAEERLTPLTLLFHHNVQNKTRKASEILGTGRGFAGPGKKALRRIILLGTPKSGIFLAVSYWPELGVSGLSLPGVSGSGLCSLSRAQKMSAQDRKKAGKSSNPLKTLCHNQPRQS